MARRQKYPQRKDGRYYAKAKGLDGVWRNISSKDPKELAKKLRAAEARAAEGIERAADNSFGAWAEKWLEARRYRTSPGQMKAYAQAIKRLSPIASIDAASVRPMDVARLISDLAERNPATGRPTSKRTLRRIIETAEQIFDWLIENRVCLSNPARSPSVIVPPAAPKSKREPLPRELAAILPSVPHRLQACVILMLYCGLRRGEACALKWADVDLKAGVVHVRRAVDWEAGPGKSKLPKNGEARDVLMPPQAIKALRPLARKPGDWAAPAASGGPMTHSAWRRAWESYIRSVNAAIQGKDSAKSGRGRAIQIDISFGAHQLRHTAASLMYMAGMDAKAVAAQLGHKSLDVTLNIYTGVDEEHIRGEMEKYGAFLGAEGSKSAQ
ncbi:MAG: site-specific integrase [Eubacteriaceae bacterium]|jgi:integrase|nr:site-specific integrase [Eubacteriaceae bacterium]